MKPPSEASPAARDRFTAEARLPETQLAGDPAWTRRRPGWLVLWVGLLLPQLVLLGPALIGRTVDLPVDLLAAPHIDYFPRRPEYANVKIQHADDVSDLLLIGPTTTGEFAAKEIRAGRLPMWEPSNFAGAPFIASYSPFAIPYYIAPYPITLAWIALCEALTVGLGMWFLLRRSFALSFWPSAIGSWCAPLTGFMTVWHGFTVIGPYCWLPWSLWAADLAIKNARGYASIGLAILTALILLSGHPGVGGLVLLTTGLYVVWRLAGEIRSRRRQGAFASALGIGAAWVLGFCLAAPYLLPLFEYGRTGARLQLQSTGFEERLPEGLKALAAIVVPDIYGGDPRVDWHRTSRVILPESSAGAYAGLLGALWLAPLACRDRRRRSQVIFLSLLAIVSLGWTLNVPGFVDLLRSEPLRPLASLSYNRWVLATSVAILILAAIGLESLRTEAVGFRWWFLFPVVVTAGFGSWCLYRRLTVIDPKDQQLFSLSYDTGAALSLAALVGWGTTLRSIPFAKWIRVAVIALLPLELLWFGWNERRQAAAALYFPRIPVLEQLALLPLGRVWGVSCFPPNLNRTHGLQDVRGYDAVDPANFIRLFNLTLDKQESIAMTYARIQYALPLARETAAGPSLHPVANLLNVRYLIFRQRPPAGLPVILEGDGYWVAENRAALPRTFVPESVQTVNNDRQAISDMKGFEFDPRKTAYVTDELRLPDAIHGEASVRYETPARAVIDADMQTAGLVLLSDMWDAGWRAELDGAACPVYRVDVALRGFKVPAGKHHIVCTYEPESVRTGFRAAAAAASILALWAITKGSRGLRSRLAPKFLGKRSSG